MRLQMRTGFTGPSAKSSSTGWCVIVPPCSSGGAAARAPAAAAPVVSYPAAPPPPGPQSGPSASDTLQQLKTLADLKAQGVLTEEEFAAQKARILAG